MVSELKSIYLYVPLAARLPVTAIAKPVPFGKAEFFDGAKLTIIVEIPTKFIIEIGIWRRDNGFSDLE